MRKRCRTKPILFIHWFAKNERSVLIRMMLVRKKTMVTRITSLEPLRRKQWKQFSRQRWSWILVSKWQFDWSSDLMPGAWAQDRSSRDRDPRQILHQKIRLRKWNLRWTSSGAFWVLDKVDNHQHWKGGRSEEKVPGKPNAETSYPDCHATGVQVGFLLSISYQSIVYSLKDAVDQNIVDNKIK